MRVLKPTGSGSEINVQGPRDIYPTRLGSSETLRFSAVNAYKGTAPEPSNEDLYTGEDIIINSLDDAARLEQHIGKKFYIEKPDINMKPSYSYATLTAVDPENIQFSSEDGLFEIGKYHLIDENYIKLIAPIQACTAKQTQLRDQLMSSINLAAFDDNADAEFIDGQLVNGRALDSKAVYKVFCIRDDNCREVGKVEGGFCIRSAALADDVISYHTKGGKREISTKFKHLVLLKLNKERDIAQLLQQDGARLADSRKEYVFGRTETKRISNCQRLKNAGLNNSIVRAYGFPKEYDGKNYDSVTGVMEIHESEYDDGFFLTITDPWGEHYIISPGESWKGVISTLTP